MTDKSIKTKSSNRPTHSGNNQLGVRDFKNTQSNMHKVFAALATFGGLFGNSGMFSPKVLVKKECLNCGTVHTHNNAYCSSYCCHAWRNDNPQKGKGNHYFGEFNLAYRTNREGVEERVSA